MSVKLLLLKSGEEVICQVQEIVNPDTKEPMGYHLHKPFRLDIISDSEMIDTGENKGYQLAWFPWAPLSKDRDFYLPGSHVLTAYDPLDSIRDQYISGIQHETYEENFKKHEDLITGACDDDMDLEKLFSEAEALLEDEDGNDDGGPEDRIATDCEDGDVGGRTSVASGETVSDQG